MDYLDDEPTSADDAAAMVAALRRQRGLGLVASMGDNPLLARLGPAAMQDAQNSQTLMQRGQDRSLTRALEARRAAEAQRAHMAGEQARADELKQRKGEFGLRLQEMRDARAARAEALGLSKLAREDAQKEKGEAKQEKEDNDSLAKLQAKLPEDASSFYSDYSTLSPFLDDETKDIPGFGPVAGRMPDLLISDEGTKTRQTAGRLGASYRKLISGSGVSNEERQELNRVTGLLESGKPASLREGLKGLKKLYDSKMTQVYGGFPDRVVRRYQENTGLYTGEGKYGKPAAAPPSPAAPVPAGMVRVRDKETGDVGLLPVAAAREAGDEVEIVGGGFDL